MNAHLDIDVVAFEQEDQITLMLELVAPAAPETDQRPAAAVEVVLDCIGSMSGDRLDAAKDALTRLIDRLDPADRLGLVAFDHEVAVVLPAGGLADKPSACAAVAALEPGGSTNLAAGLLRGLREARRVAGDAGVTVLLLSAGHANDGELDPVRLGRSPRRRAVA